MTVDYNVAYTIVPCWIIAWYFPIPSVICQRASTGAISAALVSICGPSAGIRLNVIDSLLLVLIPSSCTV